MEPLDLLAKVMPRTAARIRHNRNLYAITKDATRAYEAATADNWRNVRANKTSGNGAMALAGPRLREYARHLDENHDLVVGVFDDILNNAIGTGLMIAPRVTTPDGTLLEDFNTQIRELWLEWGQEPETTQQLGWEQTERMVGRSYLRDGECFAVAQRGAGLPGNGPVPFMLELLEADYCPFDLNDQAGRILQGVESNQWGGAAAYYFFNQHPGDPLAAMSTVLRTQTRRTPAERVMHVKFARRFRQVRGVPVIHAVLNRLQDVKDYEESERIAAKVAADMTGFIERTSEFSALTGGAQTLDKNRALQMSAGQIYTLMPGEKVGTIQSNRPNSGLEAFRNAMLRAVAAGTGGRFSSIAKDYNGTYSSQRQELVEGAVAYRVHTTYLARRFHRPTYRAWLETAIASGALRVPRTASRASLYRVDFRAPALPWIDPAKEAKAYADLNAAGLESREEIMRLRGRDPATVMKELEREQESGLFTSQVEQAAPALESEDQDEPDQGDGTNG